ncbi:MAG: hypothetical protein LBS36_12855 [Oscillospiraceae bacterium]|nr:hypothetical protein [Oscillospiraceae bacterium]
MPLFLWYYFRARLKKGCFCAFLERKQAKHAVFQVLHGVDAKGGQTRSSSGVWGIFAEYVRFRNRAKKREHDGICAKKMVFARATSMFCAVLRAGVCGVNACFPLF